MGVFLLVNRYLARICIGFLVLMFVGCSSEEEADSGISEADARYSDWLLYSHDNVVLHYPENHPFADRIPDLAAGYPAAIEADALLLQMTPPRETLHVFVYTGPGHAHELTGQRYPFVEDNSIHYWQPHYLGETVMEYVLSRWTDVSPRFKFLREGLITLMDHSQTSHHEKVKELIENGTRIPLDSLAADTVMDHNRWALRSQQAASFVDFLIYMYGLPVLKALWVSPTTWDEAVQKLLQMSSTQLDDEWVEFVEQVSEGKRPEPKTMPWHGVPPDSANQ